MPTNRKRSQRTKDNADAVKLAVVMYGEMALERWIPDRLDAAGFEMKGQPHVSFLHHIWDCSFFIDRSDWDYFFARHSELRKLREPDDYYSIDRGINPGIVRKTLLAMNLGFDLLDTPALPILARERSR